MLSNLTKISKLTYTQHFKIKFKFCMKLEDFYNKFDTKDIKFDKIKFLKLHNN